MPESEELPTKLERLRVDAPEVFRGLSAAVAAATVSRQPLSLAHALRTAGHLLHTASGQAGATEEALAQARGIAASVRPWDVADFRRLSSALSGSALDERLETSWDRAMADVTRFGAGLISGPAARRLALGGLVLDGHLTHGRRGAPILCPPSLAVGRTLVQAAMGRVLTAAGAEGFVGSALREPEILGALKLDATLDAGKLAAALPAEVGRFLSSTLDDFGRLSVGRVEEGLRGLLDALSSERRVMTGTARSGLPVEGARFEFLDVGISIAIDFGSNLIAKVLGSPEAAAAVVRLSGAVQRIQGVLAGFATSKLGLLQLCSGVLAATSMLSGLLSGEDGFQSAVLRTLQQIQRELAEFRSEVNLRLDRIERQQGAILDGLDLLFREVTAGNRNLAAGIERLQNQLSAQYDAREAAARRQAKKEFDAAATNLRGLIEGDLIDENRPAYLLHLNAIHSHAASVAFFPEFVGVDYQRITLRPDPSQLVETRPEIELVVGLLKPLCARYGRETGRGDVPNPVEWARAVQAYLEARSMAPQFKLPLFESQLKRLWADGLALRDLASTAGHEESVIAAAREYASLALPKEQRSAVLSQATRARLGPDGPDEPSLQLVPFVKSAVTEYLNALLPPEYKYSEYSTADVPTVSVRGLLGPAVVTDLKKSGEFFRNTSPFQDFKVVNDPVQHAKSAKLIELVPTESVDYEFSDALQTHFDYFQIRINWPPAEARLVGGRRTFGRGRALQQNLNGDGSWWVWNSGDPEGKNPHWGTTRELLDYCQTLVFGRYIPQSMRSGFAPWLDVKLKQESTRQQLSEFLTAATALRVFSAMARLRALDVGQDLEHLSDSRTQEGVFTTTELVGFLRAQLEGEWVPEKTWGDSLAERLGVELARTIDGALQQARAMPAEKSWRLVDETLRRLGAYMLDAGVGIDRSPAPA